MTSREADTIALMIEHAVDAARDRALVNSEWGGGNGYVLNLPEWRAGLGLDVNAFCDWLDVIAAFLAMLHARSADA